MLYNRIFISGESDITEEEFSKHYETEIASMLEDIDDHEDIAYFYINSDSEFDIMVAKHLEYLIGERYINFEGDPWMVIHVYHLFDEPSFRIGELCPDGEYRININSDLLHEGDDEWIDYEEWPIIYYHGGYDSFDDMDEEMTHSTDGDIAFIKPSTRPNSRVVKNLLRRHLIEE